MEILREFRLALFYERLQDAPAASTHDEAYELLCRTLNEVENQCTSIPYDPSTRGKDGRMYPPQEDSIRESDHPSVTKYRTRGHYINIGSNGAIQIEEIEGEGKVVFEKRGSDGKDAWGGKAQDDG